MNKIGIYYAFWTHDWDADFHPYVDKVADLGFDILEVNGGTIANMTAQERRNLLEHASARGITLSYCFGLPAKFDVASPDELTRMRGLELLGRMIKNIGEMGGGNLGGIIYSFWPATLPDGVEKQPYVDRSIASMKAAAKIATDHNVVLCMEVVNRFEQFILNTCDEALDYVKQVDSPNVKIMLDTFHMNIEEDHIGEAVKKAGSHLGHLHIGENNRRPPGYGHIPWDDLIQAIYQIGYQGNIVMEPFLMPGGQVGRDIRVFRDLSVGINLDEEARKALNFIRARLAANKS
jgi:D-psicose/D-tagatose/L-ribulose 3-epimerase